MLTIYYEKNGKAYSDFDLLEQAQEIIDDYKKGVVDRVVSTCNIIEALRVLISRDKLCFDEMTIIFNYNETITLNEKVEYSKYPEGFKDFECDFLFELRKKRIGR
jgi:hypothetical protein